MRKMESFQALMKFARPTNWPGLPTLLYPTQSHTPITNGNAMNSPSRTTVCASSTSARARSFSRTRVHPLGRAVPGWGRATSRPAVPAEPPEIGAFMVLAIDLLELTGRPLDGVLGLGALHALGEHVDDHVLRVDLGGFRGRRAGESDDARVVRGRPEALHRLVDGGPQGILLPDLRRADREP